MSSVRSLLPYCTSCFRETSALSPARQNVPNQVVLVWQRRLDLSWVTLADPVSWHEQALQASIPPSFPFQLVCASLEDFTLTLSSLRHDHLEHPDSKGLICFASPYDFETHACTWSVQALDNQLAATGQNLPAHSPPQYIEAESRPALAALRVEPQDFATPSCSSQATQSHSQVHPLLFGALHRGTLVMAALTSD